jgi:hypothetical protein
MRISRTALKLALLMAISILGIGYYLGAFLPHASEVLPSVFNEPVQTQTRTLPFKTTVNRVEYTIKPVADYEITGVVVSRHDSATWWDYIHRETNDHINIADLCVVWGKNLRTNSYQKVGYSSGQFVCYYNTRALKSNQSFDEDELSNNHVLTDSKTLAKSILSAKVGDQIRMSGHLAEYTHQQGFNYFRGTSTTRKDRGNGACETIFVKEFEVIQKASLLPHYLRLIGAILIALCCIAWLTLTPVLDE